MSKKERAPSNPINEEPDLAAWAIVIFILMGTVILIATWLIN